MRRKCRNHPASFKAKKVAVALGRTPIRVWCVGWRECNSSLGIHDALNRAMDSRFLGNDVISERHVTFTLTVIPAKAGIHFDQRIPKLEMRDTPGRGGWAG